MKNKLAIVLMLCLAGFAAGLQIFRDPLPVALAKWSANVHAGKASQERIERVNFLLQKYFVTEISALAANQSARAIAIQGFDDGATETFTAKAQEQAKKELVDQINAYLK